MRGSHFPELVAVLDRLRSPGGCPWDAAQTHQSLVEYLIEEAYESVEAIDSNDSEAMREELGDLLLQVVFHARISQEQDNGWDIDSVIDGITDKLVRRHPHVFGDEQVDSAADVELSWHERKAKEKKRDSVTDGIPETLPALMRAEKLNSRSKSVSVPQPIYIDETNELLARIETEGQLGDYLLALVASASSLGLDTEAALRKAVLRRIEEVRSHE
ncbi:MAG: MazG family protein [Candidatus Nanopelagicales bacterium]|jgi:XTP/dITP diphosphohydrolase|nr:MazG family protein [Actinomycetes bacterium]MCH9831556.1 MazG family protein [Actinomycetes bacterium]MCH9840206.1 MazG family protein [Actinomycetes bacterium]